MFEPIGILMRWLHLASVATLIGGMIYGWLVLVPATAGLAKEARDTVTRVAANLFRPLVFSAIGGLLISGMYNLATNPGHHARYYILLTIKLMLALHVFAVGIVVVTKNPAHRGRLLAGGAISGLLIILISAYLRRTF